MGTLYIVSTPIGNIEDITVRAIKILMSVPVIACEDTRVTGQLRKLIKDHFLSVAILNVGTKSVTEHAGPEFISYRDENEELKMSEVITYLQDDKDVALVSDAGTPLISDPGFRLVRECIKRKIPYTAVPGPSSILTALTLSGLPTEPFWYFGYLPAKEGKRKKMLESIKTLVCHSGERSDSRISIEKNNADSGQARMTIYPTICFLASPHRLANELVDIKSIFGDTEIVVARELTKLHEEVYHGKISEALTHFSDPKGEFVILFKI